METCKIPLHLEVERERIRRLEQYQDSNMVKTPYTTYQEFYVPFIAVMMRYNHEKKARVLTSKRHPESEDKPRGKGSETAKEQAPRRRNAVLVEEVLRIQEQQLQINQASNKIAQEDSLSSYRSAISSVDSHKPSGRISGNATKKQFLIEQRIQQLKEMERKQKIRQRKQQIESKIKEVEHSKKAHSVKRGDMSPSNVVQF